MSSTAVDFGLEGRVVIITGGGGSIGSATALEAARRGAKIALFDANDSSMSSIVGAIEAEGGVAGAFEVDVRNEASLAAAVDRVESSLGPIYGVVPTAGITRPESGEKMSLDQWQSVIDVNLTGTFLTAQAAGRRMIGRGEGSMVFISSDAGLGGVAGRANYSASKSGVIGLAKALAIDWGRSGIRVNAVCPGPVDTPMLRAVNSQEWIDKTFIPKLPMGRLAQPQDEAQAVVFLLSTYSSYITGTVLSVDGGLTAGYHTNLTQ